MLTLRPLYMIPGWLGFRDLASLITLFLIKISMFSYEKLGWRNACISRDLSNRNETFPIWADEILEKVISLSPHRSQNGVIFALYGFFHTSLCSTILVLYGIASTGLTEIFHMNRSTTKFIPLTKLI